MLTTSYLRRTRTLVVTAGVALALLPGAARAQQPIPGVVVEVATKSDVLRAMQHEAQGALDERKPSGWRSAASSYRRAAELRGNTPEALDL